MSYMVKNKLNENKNTQRHFVPFLGEIFKANDDKIKQWFLSVKNLSDRDIYIFLSIFTLVNIPECKGSIEFTFEADQ